MCRLYPSDVLLGKRKGSYRSLSRVLQGGNVVQMIVSQRKSYFGIIGGKNVYQFNAWETFCPISTFCERTLPSKGALIHVRSRSRLARSGCLCRLNIRFGYLEVGSTQVKLRMRNELFFDDFWFRSCVSRASSSAAWEARSLASAELRAVS